LGTVLGQGVAFLSLPFITQIYEVSALGKAAAILAVMNIFSMVLCLQYDQAIIIADNKKLPYILLLACSISLIWQLIIYLIGFLINWNLLIKFYFVDLTFEIQWYLPILLFTYSLFLILINLRLQQNILSKISISRSIYYGGGSIFQILNGMLFGGNEHTFIISQIIGTLIAIFYLFPYKSFILWTRKFSFFTTWYEIKKVIKEHINFPKYQMGAAFVNSISAQFPIIFLGSVFSDAWAGWYFMAYRILAAPTTLLSQAVGQVFYRDSAENDRNGKLQSLMVEKVASGLLRISFLPSIGVGILSPFLISTFLAPEWSMVGSIMQVLLISIVIIFFVSPLSPLLNVKKKQAEALFFNIILLLLKVFGLFLGYLFNSPFTSILFYSIGTALGMLIFFNFLLKSVNGNVNNIFRQAAPMIIEGGIILIISFILLQMNIASSILISCTLLLLGVATYREILRFKKFSFIYNSSLDKT